MKLRRSNRKPAPRRQTPRTGAAQSSRFDARRSTFPAQQGVALVVTIILISVITFLTIAFLALSRREKGAMTTTADQTTARLAADAALERAQAEILAPVLALTNAQKFGLLVSTNFINWRGFDPAALDPRTNVNFEYRVDGNPLTANDAIRNLLNLYFSPRPPVFVTNRLAPPFGSNEFRFYLDLNRNGRYDPSGLWPVISPDPANPYYDLNGNLMPAPVPGNTLSNFFIGDPEWIGILERPDLPHSPTNRFVSRYAYVAIPASKTLDINFIHNQAFRPEKSALDPQGRDFYRNQGVGTWEINLAAFLFDLNTNVYAWGWEYFYDPLSAFPPRGNAFVDAAAIYRWRLNGPVGLQYNLPSVGALYGPNATIAFGRDMIDGYSAGPLMLLPGGYLLNDPDLLDAGGSNLDDRTRPWPGADTPNHFFSTQDFFDRTKTTMPGAPLGIADRLLAAGTNQSSYDRYTFYRLLEQLGNDSAPDPDERLNLNYINIGGFRATNFVDWDSPQVQARLGRRGSEVFFLNAAERLIRTYTGNKFGATNIPVYVNGTNWYTPALHRLLQVAANLWDATTNRAFPDGVPFPTVFRPQFERRPGPRGADIYITNYVEVTSVDQLTGTLRDVTDPIVAANVQPNDLIFGVPLVVSARKGLPNFNEIASETVVQITRKVQLTKARQGGAAAINGTNQLFVIGISNALGAEFWNSYLTAFTRPVEIRLTNFVSIQLTNEFGAPQGDPRVQRANPLHTVAVGLRLTNFWPGWNGRDAGGPSFIVPLQTNVVFQADNAAYLQTPRPGRFVTLEEGERTRNQNGDFYFPRWWLTVTNRIFGLVVDQATRRILDCVLMSGLNGHLDIARALGQSPDGLYFQGVWATNAWGNLLSDAPGVLQQILVSLGYGDPRTDWRDYGIGAAQGASRAKEIANFMAFFADSHTAQYRDPGSGRVFYGTNTALEATTPFNPSRKFSLYLSWQANDPLVHYMPGDMLYLEKAQTPVYWDLKNLNVSPAGNNVGLRNNRYQPWAFVEPDSDVNSVNPAVKDPLVLRSDDWQFPTNKLPTLGWIGRVHRGTPWQTIFLKSTNALAGGNIVNWQRWTGNADPLDALGSAPTNDWRMIELFTTALSDNAARGRLSINQSGLAAWSAVLSGVIVLQADTNANRYVRGGNYFAYPIPPAGADLDAPLRRLVTAINDVRATNFPGGVFQHLGDILAVPELTDRSPFLNADAA
ncbi:MAG: hypothetical protein RMK20_00870, partial [Verrucomicrobiales bacterium]|nr:hypothetical protein [Verrucomicrobiales bacterium]